MPPTFHTRTIACVLHLQLSCLCLRLPCLHLSASAYPTRILIPCIRYVSVTYPYLAIFVLCYRIGLSSASSCDCPDKLRFPHPCNDKLRFLDSVFPVCLPPSSWPKGKIPRQNLSGLAPNSQDVLARPVEILQLKSNALCLKLP